MISLPSEFSESFPTKPLSPVLSSDARTRLMKSFTIFVFGMLLGLLNCLSQDKVNLLANPGFISKGERKIPSWEFTSQKIRNDPGMQEQMDWTVNDVEGVPCLIILAKKPLKTNVWWQQGVKANGGATYDVSVEAKGSLEGKGALYIGVYFLDAKGGWIGFQKIEPSPTPSGTWEKIGGKITIPENAATLGIRMGANFNGTVDLAFKNPVLALASE